ncbi:ATP-binding protein [Saprospira sp. CCB-QB6]|uniref:sensor histidine kinase n=1 Tax=Saprospira sp. CCB-QB6 TaxID=3023936 RepID=UPI00234AD88E|nr:ATP-binding protein [Saprospira sp. CCB-QB6]WCL82301.1 ATP-binding protein [Saprospira sp. CCB-QB6]
MGTQQDALTIFILLAVGTLLLGFLLFLFFFFLRIHLKRIKAAEEEKHRLEINHQKALASATVEIQERERARIAEELHDDLIAQLYRIKLSNFNPQINQMLKTSIQKARGLSHDLSPPMIDQVNMETIFLDFIEPFRQKYKIISNLNAGNNKELSKEAKLQLFRIFQELITNIDKHAKASRIDIYYRYRNNYLVLLIQDDGQGFSPNKQAGLGLKNIAMRSQILNGQFKFKPHYPHGTTFIFLNYEPTH